MRIYDGDFTVGSLIEECSTAPRKSSGLPVSGLKETVEIDIKKLNRRLAELPIAEIRRRRQRMNTFYEEVIVSSDPDRGIQFTSLLMILAHHKVINDNKSLRYMIRSLYTWTQLTDNLDLRSFFDAELDCSAWKRQSGGMLWSVSSIHFTGHDDSGVCSNRKSMDA